MDNAHPFLLTGSGQKRAKYFKSVDVDKVLVKIPTAYIVLRAQFIAAAYPSEGLYNTFNAAFSTGGKLNVFSLDQGALVFRPTLTNFHFIKKGSVHDLCASEAAST